jgi:hypothetical protein
LQQQLPSERAGNAGLQFLRKRGPNRWTRWKNRVLPRDVEHFSNNVRLAVRALTQPPGKVLDVSPAITRANQFHWRSALETS